MSHKDPITGCTVADIWEVFTLDEMQEMWEEKAQDEQDWKTHLETSKEVFIEVTEWVRDLNENDPEYALPLPVTQIGNVQIGDAHFTRSGSVMSGILTAQDTEGVIRKYKFSFEDDGGDFYQPPEHDGNVELVE